MCPRHITLQSINQKKEQKKMLVKPTICVDKVYGVSLKCSMNFVTQTNQQTNQLYHSFITDAYRFVLRV